MSSEMSQAIQWDGTDLDFNGYSQVVLVCTVSASVAYTVNLVVNGVLVPIPLLYSGTTTTTQQTTVSSVGVYYIPVGGVIRLNGGTGGTFYLKGMSLPAVFNTSTTDVGTQYRANATGAASQSSVMSPATPTATAAKTAAGRLLGFVLNNSSASVRSVKFWNTAVAGVTLGTTAALWEIDIPAGQTVTFEMVGGMAFATAITYAVTGAKGLTDNTAVTLNDVTGVILFA